MILSCVQRFFLTPNFVLDFADAKLLDFLLFPCKLIEPKSDMGKKRARDLDGGDQLHIVGGATAVDVDAESNEVRHEHGLFICFIC